MSKYGCLIVKVQLLKEWWNCFYFSIWRNSVPSKKILHWANVCFSAHAVAQPCRRHTNSEVFQGLCHTYTILNLECYKYARMRF